MAGSALVLLTTALLVAAFFVEPVRVSFDAPEVSSDGGALLLRQVDVPLSAKRNTSGTLSVQSPQLMQTS